MHTTLMAIFQVNLGPHDSQALVILILCVLKGRNITATSKLHSWSVGLNILDIQIGPICYRSTIVCYPPLLAHSCAVWIIHVK